MSWVSKKREMQKRVEDDDPILLLSGGKFQSQQVDPSLSSTTNVVEETASNFFSINSSEDLYDHIETPDNPISSPQHRLPSSLPPSTFSSKQPPPSSSSEPFDVDSFINNFPLQPPIPSSNKSLPTTPPQQQGSNNKKNLPNVPPSKPPPTATTEPKQPTTINTPPHMEKKPLPTRVPSNGSLPIIVNPKVAVSEQVAEPIKPTMNQQQHNNEFSFEMFEQLKKQLLKLEEENQKLKKELGHKNSIVVGSSDDSTTTPNNSSNTKYDDYFEEEKVEVKTLGDLIREGLECNGLNKTLLEKVKKRKVTKPPVYKELVDEEEELINESFDDDEYEYRYRSTDQYSNQGRELDAWCNLRRLRESKQKVALLKSCEKNYDVVIPIIISIEQSLAFRSFMEVLIEADRESGFYVLIYISFLKKLGDGKTLQRVFKFNNMIRDEALLQYKMAISIHDPYEKMDALEHCLSFIQKNAQAIDNPVGFNHFKHSLNCAEELSIATANMIHLISKQIKIDEQDNAIALSGRHQIFKQYRKFPVYGSTLSETMKYCLFYHNAAPEDQIACPRTLAKFFDLSQHRFFYDAIVARSRIGDWKGVMIAYSKAQKDGLCYCSSYDMKMQKGNSGFMKLLTGKPNRADSNSILNIYNVMQVLKLFRAPIPMIRDLLQSFSFQKTEMELKTEIAKEYGIYDIAIQCIVNELKDRDMLIKLKEDINRRYMGSDKISLQEEINNHLYNKKMKWKKATINL